MARALALGGWDAIGLIQGDAQILAPKLVQSLVAAWCDYATFKVARKLLSPRHQNTAVREDFFISRETF